MKIGLTYDLYDDYVARGFSPEAAAEFDREDTIAAIEATLGELGYETERIGHVMNLAQKLVAGERWDLVFNIAEGVAGLGREAQVPALLDAYGIPYTFSDPLVLCVSLHKATAKRVVRDLGVPTPDFAVVERAEEALKVDLPFPVFAKPVAEGTSKGISTASRARSHGELMAICEKLLAQFNQPVLVETYLPGREFTVGMLGTGEQARVVGVMEVMVTGASEEGIYSFNGKKTYEETVRYELAEDRDALDAARVALMAWRGMGCRDGGRVDVRLDGNGVPNFIEVNPLAGLNPTISDLCILCGLKGMSYRELIGGIMESAIQRVKEPESVTIRAAGGAL